MNTKDFLWWLRGFLTARDSCALSAEDVRLIQFKLLHADLPETEPAKPPAASPAPFVPKQRDWINDIPPYGAPFKGCAVCGLGADGSPMGYVCPRNDCPTAVRCAT